MCRSRHGGILDAKAKDSLMAASSLSASDGPSLCTFALAALFGGHPSREDEEVLGMAVRAWLGPAGTFEMAAHACSDDTQRSKSLAQ